MKILNLRILILAMVSLFAWKQQHQEKASTSVDSILMVLPTINFRNFPILPCYSMGGDLALNTTSHVDMHI